MQGTDNTKVAVVGAAGRFPGASDLRSYWELLLDGRVVAAEPDRSRTELWEAMSDPALAARITTLKAGYLDDVAGFDAEYFNISPREAVKLDPQQRLLLEAVHDALEDAAIERTELASLTVGVFVGAGSSDYITLDSRDKRLIDAYHGIGNSHGLLANRISYYYNLRGPSLTVDTACSSSLTALHVALQHLRQGEIDLAIVGGVNVIASPDLTLAFSQAKMLSPSGRCRTFSADADGYGRAEAVGAVVLCRLSDAQRRRYAVRCVIGSVAVNQDGRSNGITAPNGQSQMQVIQAAMAGAGVTPADVAYVETHGTGTPLGDAIEFNSLKNVFVKFPDARCLIGSAKANIGHAEAAAGICGLLKAMLMLERGVVPPHPVDGPYNELIDGGGEALRIGRTAERLDPQRRCIGVSSFGFGGSNAHAVVERYERRESSREARRPRLVVLSSHFAEGLAADARAFADFLTDTRATLGAIAGTLGCRRDHLKYRRAWVVHEREELRSRLVAPWQADGPRIGGAGAPKIAFVFAGQGGEYFGMGRALYERVVPFTTAFNRCAGLIEEHAGVSITGILYGNARRGAARLQEDTHAAQLALFCFEYALAQCWMAVGIAPDFVIGHGLGELAAHAVAGGLSLVDAVVLVHERARLAPPRFEDDATMAVSLSADDVRERLDRLGMRLRLAAVNGKRDVVVSGARGSIVRLAAELADDDIPHCTLDSRSVAHSSLCAEAAARLAERVRHVRANATAVPVVSGLDGAVVPAARLTPEYWGEQSLRPVQFARGVAGLVERGINVFLEIGPERSLSTVIERDHAGVGVRTIGGGERGEDAEYALLDTAGALYCMGYDVKFAPLTDSPAGFTRASLPARRLRRKRYWTAATAASFADRPARGAATVADAPDLQSVIRRQVQVMKSQLLLLDRRRTPIEPAAAPSTLVRR